MKTTPPDADSPQPWRERLAEARRDAGPTIDQAALRRVVVTEARLRRAAPAPGAAVWWADLLVVCEGRRVAAWCTAGLAACAVLSGWEIWQGWQELAWAQFAGLALGGGL